MSGPRLVVAFTAPCRDGVHFIGEEVGHYDQPTTMIDVGGDRPATWATALTRDATAEEAITYWRNRATGGQP